MLHSVTRMTSMQLPPGYIGATDAARHLGVSRQTVYRWLELGLPSHQPAGPRGRRIFKLTELDAWIDSR